MSGLDPAARDAAVRRAFEPVRAMVQRSPSRADREYFDRHEHRLRRTPERLMELVPAGARVLDVGSHFLHTAAAVQALGYSVQGIDVPAFAGMPLVVDRARSLGLTNHATTLEAFAEDDALGERVGPVDAVLFCEILEHITFNPVRFWQRIHGLLPVGGIVYLTTPNAFKLLSVLGAARGLATGTRLGLNVRQIFAHATYGHHWKEFSAREIRQYFAMLSPDFDVRVRRFHVRAAATPFAGQGAVGRMKEAVRQVGNASGLFAEQLEAVVTLRARTPWTTGAPSHD